MLYSMMKGPGAFLLSLAQRVLRARLDSTRPARFGRSNPSGCDHGEVIVRWARFFSLKADMKHDPPNMIIVMM